MLQATPQSHTTERLLRLEAVTDNVCLRESAIYAGVKTGTFPASIKLSRALWHGQKVRSNSGLLSESKPAKQHKVAEMQYPSIEAEALAESSTYNATHPRRVPPADSPNRPALEHLYAIALAMLRKRPGAKWFVCDGVQYGVIWQSSRMCVVHRRTHRILVGAPGVRHD